MGVPPFGRSRFSARLGESSGQCNDSRGVVVVLDPREPVGRRDCGPLPWTGEEALVNPLCCAGRR